MRRIATPVLGFVIGAAAAIGAETAAIRISAPSLGWVLSPDGTQVIEISGVMESPRIGRTVDLPAAARHSWASPDASATLVRLDSGLFLLRNSEPIQLVAELPADIAVSAAWDRASAGFAVCWNANCESRGADGAIRSSWESESGSRVIAYSAESGLAIATSNSAQWLRGDGRMTIESVPAAAAFRPGSNELWLLNGDGRLTGRDFQGRPVGEAQMLESASGLVAARDGKAFFTANAEGEAAVFSVETQQVERSNIGDTVEGIWPLPGLFGVRFHESAKRPIAVWNGETGLVSWMPAQTAGIEVVQ